MAEDLLNKYPDNKHPVYEHCPNCGKRSVRMIEGHKECANCEHRPDDEQTGRNGIE